MKILIYSLSIISLLLSLPLSAMEEQEATSITKAITTLDDVEERLGDDPDCASMAKVIRAGVESCNEDLDWEKIFGTSDQAKISRTVKAFDEFLKGRKNVLFQLKAASGKRNDAEYERLNDEYKFVDTFSNQLDNAWSNTFMKPVSIN